MGFDVVVNSTVSAKHSAWVRRLTRLTSFKIVSYALLLIIPAFERGSYGLNTPLPLGHTFTVLVYRFLLLSYVCSPAFVFFLFYSLN